MGTHSPRVSRLLKSLGHEVIVANARQMKLISSSRKSDKLNAPMLARLARVDPELLRPIQHRSEQGQAHLTLIRVRAALVDARTGLVNAARGFAKAAGERLPACDTSQMGVRRETYSQQAPRIQDLMCLSAQWRKGNRRMVSISENCFMRRKLLIKVCGPEVSFEDPS